MPKPCACPRSIHRLVLAAALLACPSALGQLLPFAAYTPDDGLAASQVWTVFQDSRGYLWLGTAGGLSRWDGVAFESLTTLEGLRDPVIRTIAEDHQGQLWLGTNIGVSRYDGQVITNYSLAEGLADGIVWSSLVDDYGTPWFATSSGGVSAFVDGGFRTYGPAEGMPAAQATTLQTTADGHLWIGFLGGGLLRCRLAGGGSLSQCVTYTTADGLAGDGVRQALLDPADGELYVALSPAGVSRFDGTRFESFAVTVDGRQVAPHCLLVNRRHELVIGTREHGLLICPLPAMQPCRNIRRANGLAVDNVWDVREDREGNLWVGTNVGLNRLHSEALISFSDSNGLADPVTLAIHADDNGDAWLGSFGGLARISNPADRFGEQQVEVWNRDNGLPANEVWSVTRDSRGRLWIGTGGGLCQLQPGAGCVRVYDRDDGLADDYVLDIRETADGELWLGNAVGVTRVRFDAAGANPSFEGFSARRGFTGRMAHAVYPDEHGQVWIGTRGQGLIVYDGETFHAFTTENGLPDDSIIALAPSSDGLIWAGTNAGLVSFVPPPGPDPEPEFRACDEHSPLHRASIVAVRESAPGQLWVLTTKGAYLLETAGDPGCGTVRTFLDRHAGLIGNEGTSGNAIAIDPRGRVWFGLGTGATRYDPTLATQSPPPPVATLERVETGRGRVLRAAFSPARQANEELLAGSGPLTLPPDDTSLRFEFRGLSFSQESSVRYQSRLQGFESDWSTATATPFKEYTNLDPGSYTFQVRASAPEGGWGEPIALSFEVLPAFWQTPAFAASAVFVIAALLLAGHRARTHRIQARARQLEQIVAARTDDLKRYAQALEDHSHALDQANVRAREADRMKSEFLANMSHDLRAPLNSIIGFAEVLIPRLEGGISDRHLGFLRNIKESGHHLLQLIDNLLDLSKIEAGKMEFHLEETTLEPILEGVCAVMRGLAQKRGVTISLIHSGPQPTVAADVPKLRQILYNLISNAVKFSPKGAEVEVRTRAVPAAESHLGVESYEVAVVDHGIGMSEEDHEVIFQEFRQLHASGERPAGTGLGLAIVKRFVAAFEGSIHVQSAPGEGCTFTVLLPTRPTRAALPTGAEAGVAQELARRPEAPRRRVLVVEDDREAFVALASALEQEGFLAVRAHHGEEALRMAKEIDPAVVALDLVLPGLDGWSVFRALKQDPDTAHLPVVIVSMLDNRQLGFALGVDAYFVKPVVTRELVDTLQRLTAARSRAQAGPVLVIDDDRHTRELLHEALSEIGIEVLLAANGEQGLEVAASQRPVVIVLDLMMPGMSGFEVAHRLQQDPRTSSIPILVLTAKDLTRADRRRLSGRVLATFGKAASYDQLLHTIQTLLARRMDRE